MPSISDQVRLIILIIVGVATFISGSLTNVLGENINDFGRRKLLREKNLGDPPAAKPLRIWITFIIFSLVAGVGAAVATVAPEIVEWDPMTGDYRVVFSGFEGIRGSIPRQDAKEISRNSYERIAEALEGNSSDLYINTWGPDDLKARGIQAVTGDSTQARTDSAAQLAETVDADVVVYGFIESQGGLISITPEFYVRIRNYYEAEEISGPYGLGSPVTIRNFNDLADRIELNRLLSARVQALSQILLGLAHYSIRDYAKALEIFRQGETIENWEDDQGKHLLYLFIANSAIRPDEPDLDLAEEYYRKALEIEPGYARALIGLANVYYRRALLPMKASNDTIDLDRALIDQAIATLQRALQSENISPSADITAKVHFELGQNYFMLAYCGFDENYAAAQAEFDAVIAEYGDGANPRIQERAAEAHARLGLIDSLTGDPAGAIKEYEIAVDMLKDYPQRQEIFRDSLRKLQPDQNN